MMEEGPSPPEPRAGVVLALRQSAGSWRRVV
jgi:hypothetical protein